MKSEDFNSALGSAPCRSKRLQEEGEKKWGAGSVLGGGGLAKSNFLFPISLFVVASGAALNEFLRKNDNLNGNGSG
jgi:hypothetical protein